MRNLPVSNRLKQAAGMAVSRGKICEPGCDHAYLSIYMILNGMAAGTVAMDIKPAPLRAAEANVKLYGVDDRVDIRLSDGLGALKPGECDTIVLAGMGGELMMRILMEGAEKFSGDTSIILQPQSEIEIVRAWLEMAGLEILQEECLKESGKYYFFLKVIDRGNILSLSRAYAEKCSEIKYIKDIIEKLKYDLTEKGITVSHRYGEILLRERHPVLMEYIDWQKSIWMKASEELEKSDNKENNRYRINEVTQRLLEINTVLNC